MPSGARLGNTIHALGARVVRATGDPARPPPPSTAAPTSSTPRSTGRCSSSPRRTTRASPSCTALNNTGQTGGVADADIDAPEGWDVAGLGAFPHERRRQGRHRRHRHRPRPTRTSPARSSTARSRRACSRRDHRRRCADDNGHGTHVAGTITANANNGHGVAGVAFNSPLVICKALSGPLGSGSTADVANCITWVHDRGREGDLDEPRRRRVDDAAERGHRRWRRRRTAR